jgi:hypothetical protein
LTYKYMYKTNFNNINATGVVVLPESAKKMIAEFDAAMAKGGVDKHSGH